MVRALLDVYGAGPSEALEISMEMDPGTFDAPRLQGFVQGAGGWLYIIYIYIYVCMCKPIYLCIPQGIYAPSDVLILRPLACV